MVEIFNNFERLGILPKVYGERYERNTYQTLTKDEFDKSLIKLQEEFDVTVEESPLFPLIYQTPNLLKKIKIKQKKYIKRKQYMYMLINCDRWNNKELRMFILYIQVTKK